MHNGFVTIDLADELSRVRRTELAHALQARPSPRFRGRAIVGAALVRTGVWIIGPPDRAMRPTGVTGTPC